MGEQGTGKQIDGIDVEFQFDLDVYTPYLLNRTGVRIADAFDHDLKRHGINLQMWRIVAALWHSGQVRLSDLSHLTSIEISTLSRGVARLADKGYIERQKSGNDGREVRLQLSDQGRQMTARLIPMALQAESDLIRGFSPDEVKVLKNLLMRMYQNLDTRNAR